MPYNEKYEVNTCSLSGIPVRIVLSKLENNPPIDDPISIGVVGFKIKGKKTDNPCEPVNGSEITLTLKSGPGFVADDVATEDEREWRTDIYFNSVLFWSGFNLPEGLDEPYSYDSYNITINANDTIGNLKNIPYSADIPYTGFDSDKNIIVKCLAKTGLNLPIIIGINTFEDSMDLEQCPLEQSEINQARFIDKNGKVFSCHEVLRSILERYGARLVQAKGAWYIINTLEQITGAVDAWAYTSAGVLIGDTVISDNITAGGIEHVATVITDSHNISKARAFKSAMSYYQYGFSANNVNNGNFNALDGDFLLNWEKLEGVTASVGLTTTTNQETGEVIETGHSLHITHAEHLPNRQRVSSMVPIQIRANQKATISFDMYALVPIIDGGFDAAYTYTLRVYVWDNHGRAYTKYGWEQGSYNSYDLYFKWVDLNGKSNNVSFDVAPAGADYQMTFAFGMIKDSGDNLRETHYDNLDIQTAVSDEVLNPPIGDYIRLTQTKNLTYVPDPVVILHADEVETQRTSQILVDGLPTTSWARKGISEAVKILYTVADSYLRINAKPKKIFDGTFASKHIISPLTTFAISQLSGNYVYMSGDFDLLNEEYVLSLFEGFNDPVNIFTPYEFGVDTGNLKDQNGNVVSPPTGISNPPQSGNGPGSALTARMLFDENGYLLVDGNKIASGYADVAGDAELWDGHEFDDYMDQPVRTIDEVLFASVKSDNIQSEVYVSGVLGSGFRITPDGAEFQNLTVRETFTVTTLNIREITGTGGAIAITNVAKIILVEDEGTSWKCSIDTAAGSIALQLQVNDIVRCQVWDGTGIKYYSARVSAIGTGYFNLDKTGKDGSGEPEAGDTVFQFGNTTNTDRQGLIYITNSDTDSPYLDILDGIDSPDLTGKTKVRLGKLDGITDADLGSLDGYGLYAERAFIKGQVKVFGDFESSNASGQKVVISGDDNNLSFKDSAGNTQLLVDDNIIPLEGGGFGPGIQLGQIGDNFLYMGPEGLFVFNTTTSKSAYFRTTGIKTDGNLDVTGNIDIGGINSIDGTVPYNGYVGIKRQDDETLGVERIYNMFIKDGLITHFEFVA